MTGTRIIIIPPDSLTVDAANRDRAVFQAAAGDAAPSCTPTGEATRRPRQSLASLNVVPGLARLGSWAVGQRRVSCMTGAPRLLRQRSARSCDSIYQAWKLRIVTNLGETLLTALGI